MRGVRAAWALLGVVTPLSLVALMDACGARSGLFPEESTSTLDAAVSEDVVIPPLDAQGPDVVPPSACADASDTLIYAVTESNTLVMFNPSSAQFTPIG